MDPNKEQKKCSHYFRKIEEWLKVELELIEKLETELLDIYTSGRMMGDKLRMIPAEDTGRISAMMKDISWLEKRRGRVLEKALTKLPILAENIRAQFQKGFRDSVAKSNRAHEQLAALMAPVHTPLKKNYTDIEAFCESIENARKDRFFGIMELIADVRCILDKEDLFMHNIKVEFGRGKGEIVLDTNFIMDVVKLKNMAHADGYDFDFGKFDVTVPKSVIDEMRRNNIGTQIVNSLRSKGAKVIQITPTKKESDEICRVWSEESIKGSKDIRDIENFRRKADVKILVYARRRANGYKKTVIVTDDYDIKDVSRHLGRESKFIKVMPVKKVKRYAA